MAQHLALVTNTTRVGCPEFNSRLGSDVFLCVWHLFTLPCSDIVLIAGSGRNTNSTPVLSIVPLYSILCSPTEKIGIMEQATSPRSHSPTLTHSS